MKIPSLSTFLIGGLLGYTIYDGINREIPTTPYDSTKTFKAENDGFFDKLKQPSYEMIAPNVVKHSGGAAGCGIIAFSETTYDFNKGTRLYNGWSNIELITDLFDPDNFTSLDSLQENLSSFGSLEYERPIDLEDKGLLTDDGALIAKEMIKNHAASGHVNYEGWGSDIKRVLVMEVK